MNKRFQTIKPSQVILLLTVLFIILGLGACNMPLLRNTSMVTNMPSIQMETARMPVKILAGPYIAELSPVSATVCFITDRKVQAGIKVSGHGIKQVQRSGKPVRYHVLKTKNLRPGLTFRAQLLIKNGPSVTFAITTFPEAKRTLNLAFLQGGAENPQALEQAIKLCKKRNPQAIFLSGDQVKRSRTLQTWIDDFFKLYKSDLQGMTLLRAPDRPLLPKEVFPLDKLNESYSVDAGLAFIILIAPGDLRPEKRFRFLPWLKNELGRAGFKRKIVILPQSILTSGTKGINSELLHNYGPVFEKYGVDIVMSSGKNFYHRSLPVGNAESQVNYLNLASLSVASIPAASSDYTARQSSVPAVLFLRVNGQHLSGELITLDGIREDLFIINNKEDKPSSVVFRKKLVTSAWALDSQKRELLAIVRQVCQAVKNPGKTDKINIIVNNPSPLPFKGFLQWQSDAAMYFVTPERINFNLKPGAGIKSSFLMRPNKLKGKMPLLQAVSSSGQVAEERMLLTWQQQLQIPRNREAFKVDGKAEEKFWKQATEVTNFFSIDGKVKTGKQMLIWLIAGNEGLRIRFRCPFIKGSKLKNTLKSHDGNIWNDESIEVYIDYKHQGREYYQFAVSSANLGFEANSTRGRDWNPYWQHAVTVKKDRYNVEILIPYAAFNLAEAPAKGTTWGINLTRNNYSKGKCEVTQAAPTHGSNGRSGCYLELVFN